MGSGVRSLASNWHSRFGLVSRGICEMPREDRNTNWKVTKSVASIPVKLREKRPNYNYTIDRIGVNKRYVLAGTSSYAHIDRHSHSGRVCTM